VVAVVTDYSYADVVERLFREFGDRVSLTLIVEVVHECRKQLSGVAEPAMSEMLERLARQRLSSRLQSTLSPSPGETSGALDYRLDAHWPRTSRDARDEGIASAKFATGR
jgi:hypothetical protein